MTLEIGQHVKYQSRKWVVLKLNLNSAIVEPVGGDMHQRKNVSLKELIPTGDKEDLKVIEVEKKLCSGCGEAKPIKDFGSTDGQPFNKCKICLGKLSVAGRTKCCTKCEEEKPLSEFDRQNRYKLRNICKECMAEAISAGHSKRKEEKKLAESKDPIKPSHYQMEGRDLIDQWAERYPKEVFIGIMESHIEKYVVRHTKKGKPVEDLEKALEYINRLKKYHEEVGS